MLRGEKNKQTKREREISVSRREEKEKETKRLNKVRQGRIRCAYVCVCVCTERGGAKGRDVHSPAFHLFDLCRLLPLSRSLPPYPQKRGASVNRERKRRRTSTQNKQKKTWITLHLSFFLVDGSWRLCIPLFVNPQTQTPRTCVCTLKYLNRPRDVVVSSLSFFLSVSLYFYSFFFHSGASLPFFLSFIIFFCVLVQTVRALFHSSSSLFAMLICEEGERDRSETCV